MPAHTRVAPTKSALLALHKQVRFLEQGHDMLERKRELLNRVIHERLRSYRILRREVRARLETTYHWLALAQLRMGGQMLRQSVLGLGPALAVQILPRSSVGVEYPSVRAEALPLKPVALMWTDPSFDQARIQLAQTAVLLARLGEAETALWRLLSAQRKTQKRVNALRYNIIPGYRRAMRAIREALDENERDSLFQAQRLREQGYGV